jgi:hypothetical protein
MDNGTLFYVTGGILAVSAVVVSFLGLRLEKFPGRATPLIALWFAVLIGCATTFSVLHAKDEEKHETAALHKAGEQAERAEAQ